MDLFQQVQQMPDWIRIWEMLRQVPIRCCCSSSAWCVGGWCILGSVRMNARTQGFPSSTINLRTQSTGHWGTNLPMSICTVLKDTNMNSNNGLKTSSCEIWTRTPTRDNHNNPQNHDGSPIPEGRTSDHFAFLSNETLLEHDTSAWIRVREAAVSLCESKVKPDLMTSLLQHHTCPKLHNTTLHERAAQVCLHRWGKTSQKDSQSLCRWFNWYILLALCWFYYYQQGDVSPACIDTSSGINYVPANLWTKLCI